MSGYLIALGLFVLAFMVAITVLGFKARNQYLKIESGSPGPHDTGLIAAVGVLSILGVGAFTYLTGGFLMIVTFAIGVASLLYLGSLKYKGEKTKLFPVTYWNLIIGGIAGAIGGVVLVGWGISSSSESTPTEEAPGINQ